MCKCCIQNQNCSCPECVKSTLEQLIGEVDKAIQKLDAKELSEENKHVVKSSKGLSLKKVIAIVIITAGVGAAISFILFGGGVPQVFVPESTNTGSGGSTPPVTSGATPDAPVVKNPTATPLYPVPPVENKEDGK